MPNGFADDGGERQRAVVCGTIASGATTAVAVIVAQMQLTDNYGLDSPDMIYTVPATTASGYYLVTVHKRADHGMGTCGAAPCTGEAITLQWNDGSRRRRWRDELRLGDAVRRFGGDADVGAGRHGDYRLRPELRHGQSADRRPI